MDGTKLYCTNECTDEKEDCDSICCHNCSEFETCMKHDYVCSFLRLSPNATSEEIMAKCDLFGKEVIS